MFQKIKIKWDLKEFINLSFNFNYETIKKTNLSLLPLYHLEDNGKDDKILVTEFIKNHKFYEYSLYAGFIPMYHLDYDIFNPFSSNLKEYTILKLHKKRSILFFENITIHKTTKKRIKKYSLTINKNFNKVFTLLHSYHTNKYGFCWFSKSYKKVIRPLVNNIKKLVSFHSIELWNKENNNLAAGEIGVVIGSRYLSLTGFYNEKGAGSVLLALLANLLEKMSFSFWDLGMEMAYKNELGAKTVDIDYFLKLVEKTRDKKIPFHL